MSTKQKELKETTTNEKDRTETLTIIDSSETDEWNVCCCYFRFFETFDAGEGRCRCQGTWVISSRSYAVDRTISAPERNREGARPPRWLAGKLAKRRAIRSCYRGQVLWCGRNRQTEAQTLRSRAMRSESLRS